VALGARRQRRKACLIFDEERYRYQAYVSDVAGQDIASHAGDPRALVVRLRDWLASHVATALPSGGVVWDHYLTFQGELQHACERARHRADELTYLDLLRHMSRFRNDYVELLTVNGEHETKNPAPEEIRRAVRGAARQHTQGPFVILTKGANGLTYMQAKAVAADSWVVEYQEGHLDRHFRGEQHLSTDALVGAFLSYAAGEDAWRTCARWIRYEVQ